MKKMFLMALMTLAVWQGAVAQERKKDEDRSPRYTQRERPSKMSPKERVAFLDKELQLTEAQEAKILKIFQKHEEKKYTSPEARRKGMQKTHKKVNKVLDKEQQAKFAKLSKEMHGKHGSRKDGGRPVPPKGRRSAYVSK